MLESLVAQQAKAAQKAAEAAAVAAGKTEEEKNTDIAKATKAAIDAEKQPVAKEELPQKTKQIIENVEIIANSGEADVVIEPVLAIAPPNAAQEDTCDLGFGPGCPIMAIADEAEVVDGKQELTILETAEEKDSWAVMAEDEFDPKLLAKQTRLVTGEKDYKMECWDEVEQEWGQEETFLGADGGATYECNENVILVGSMAGICTRTTCKNGGLCSATASSFVCNCADGWTGPLCEEAIVASHCTAFDCSSSGGHKVFATYDDGACSVAGKPACSDTLCCQNSVTAFRALCDGLTDAKQYVNAGCCDRC